MTTTDFAQGQCGNCGRTIGKLETPLLWKENVVCAECHSRLTQQNQDRRAELLAMQPRSEAQRNTPAVYADHLKPARVILLLIAVAVSFMSALSKTEPPDFTFAWIAWGAWIVMGLVSIVMKANWKANHG